MNPSSLLRATTLLALLAAPAVEATVCRVAPGGNGNGTSWPSAMALQSALANTACTEIWVRQGLYKPVLPANLNDPSTAERETSFAIRAGTRVFGGFAGSEALRDQRDPKAHLSVLSGDIDNNDITDADGIVTEPANVRYGNSYHVVTLDGGTAQGAVMRNTVLDGVVITAGRAQGGETNRRNRGGGLLCLATNTGQQCSPTLREVLFSANVGSYGAAMNLLATSGGIAQPLLQRVRFSRNQASSGGALYNDGSNAGRANPELLDVEFTGNHASSQGGAMFNSGEQGHSSPSLNRVGFSGNSANSGGAIYNDGSSGGTARAIITNTTFAGNNASGNGGAIYNYSGNGDGRMTLNHATFNGNAAARGGAIYNYGASNNVAKAGQQIGNTILWGNSASNEGPEIFNYHAEPVIRDSIIAGGCPANSQCSGILTGNPALGALADNGGFSRTLLPNTGSAAINTAANQACPLDDQRGVPRAQGTRCDMGAVEVEAPACYVKHDAVGSNNGSSWANAHTRLQDALASASCGEIRVANGIYTPTDGSDRTISFKIRPGQRVYGGFNGTETTLAQRDPATHRTILSGDIDHNDITDAHGLLVTVQGNNSKRIVLMDGTTSAGTITANTVLDGFAITAARGYDQNGGGLLCKGSGHGNECSPTLRNLLFSGNLADSGGGIYNAGSAGGRASPTLINVSFDGGSSWLGGGGMYNNGSGQYQANNGGEASPTLTNVTFIDNWATAMVNDGRNGGSSSPALNHVTFYANKDRWTAASMVNDASFGGTSTPVLDNVILWGGAFSSPEEPGECAADGHMEICNLSAQPTIRHSLIAGGCPAGALCDATVRDLDPKLHPLAWNGGSTLSMEPRDDSPAIDAGADDVCAEFDQRGVSRPQGAHCDIGAVEASNDRIFRHGFEAQ
ncbi:MAG TPA: choice-of-anchor Q domain-containing protein [Rhodanobacteraceae bacterium]|nr:choice-of-anchor Q domain-containing protein [Rhodanobacteraceae bacterium]